MARRARADLDAVDDAGLTGLARGGDRDAFAVIMTRHNQRLFRAARAVVRDDAEAEDVLQEAWLRAYRALDGFRGEAALSTWLTRIVLNEARGRLRRRRPLVGLDQIERAQDAGGQVIPFPNSLGPDAEADVARGQMRRLLEQAVDELPEAFRVVFILRAVEELSIEEAAAVLALKPETVKTRLHRARRLLRRALDEKLALAAGEAFPFMGARCARITAAVLARLEADAAGTSGAG